MKQSSEDDEYAWVSHRVIPGITAGYVFRYAMQTIGRLLRRGSTVC